MDVSRINTVMPATVAIVGPRRGLSERVRGALSQLDAIVCVHQTLRQLRSVGREQPPTLVVLEVPELSIDRLNAEVDLLRGGGIQSPIFVITGSDLAGCRQMQLRDIVDFAAGQASSTEILTRITRVLDAQCSALAGDARSEPASRTIQGVRLDWRAKRATFNGKTVKLTTSELRLLEAFLDHPAQLLSTGTLLRAVWGENEHRSDNLVAVYIFSLRGKLPRLGGGFWIETEVGSGYRLVTDSATPKRRKNGVPRANSTRRSA